MKPFHADNNKNYIAELDGGYKISTVENLILAWYNNWATL